MKSDILTRLIEFLDNSDSIKLRCRIFSENPKMRTSFCLECKDSDECHHMEKKD